MNPRAATFRDRDNHVVGTTWGGTWCWHPVNPAKYASESEDGTDAHLIRCRRCPGCMELDRRELAERLVLTFNKEEGNVWVAIVEVVLGEAGAIASSIARTTNVARYWGWCRIGASRIAVIVEGQKPRPRVRRPPLGCSVSWHRVNVRRKRRAWLMV